MPEGDIEIRFGEDSYAGNYLTDLVINEQDMNQILGEHPGKFIFWSRMSSLAKIILERAKQDLDQYEAQMYGYFKSQAEQQNQKATERSISSRLLLDERRQELFTVYLRLRLQADHLTSIAEAFKLRTHMLMSISANIREEWQGPMSVRGDSRLAGEHNRRLAGSARPPMPTGSRTDGRAARLRGESGQDFGGENSEADPGGK